MLCIILVVAVRRSGATCEPCPPGYSNETFSGSGLQNGKCNQCLFGFYNEHEGAKTCTQCPAGKTTLANGKPKNGSPSASDCAVLPKPETLKCTAGQFPDPLTTSCVACPNGLWRGALCNNVLVWGESSCCSCPKGTTTLNSGAMSALMCVSIAGPTTAPTQSPTKINCPLGQGPTPVGSSGALACLPCDFGTYGRLDDKLRQNVCTPCPSGMTTKTNGATAEEQCDVEDCPPGKTMVRSQVDIDTQGSNKEPDNSAKANAMMYGGVGVALAALIVAGILGYHCYYKGKKKAELELQQNQQWEDGGGGGWGEEGGRGGGGGDACEYYDNAEGGGHGYDDGYDDNATVDGDGGRGGRGGQGDIGRPVAQREEWEEDAQFAARKPEPKRVSVLSPVHPRSADDEAIAAAARRMTQRLGQVGAPRKNSLATPSSAVLGTQSYQVPSEAQVAAAAMAKRMSQAQSNPSLAAAATAARAKKDSDDALPPAPAAKASPPKRPSLAPGKRLPAGN